MHLLEDRVQEVLPDSVDWHLVVTRLQVLQRACDSRGLHYAI
jgi:hypothetical protein